MRKQLPKPEQSLSDRESEDLEVSRFYLDSGDYAGSYMRAQDAVRSVPDDPEAHFALARSAVRMKKPEEAMVEFREYLKLDPEGQHVAVAQQELRNLSPR